MSTGAWTQMQLPPRIGEFVAHAACSSTGWAQITKVSATNSGLPPQAFARCPTNSAEKALRHSQPRVLLLEVDVTIWSATR